ncbi:MAG: CDP-glycerol glycerophosphotransferase family protein [Longicatena sp.]
MGLKKAVLTCLLQVCNFFFRMCSIKQNRITFISLTADHLEQDFLEIDKLLREDNKYDLHYNLIVFKKTLKDDFMYMLNCIRQLYEINVSKLIILNDNNFVVSTFKREGTYVLQTWHACGAIKKFGNQIERQYPVRNYDGVLANSTYWKDAYHEAFGVKQEQVIITGMPRVDKLCDEEIVSSYKERFYEKYPQYRDQYKVLYAPTFRGNIIKGLRYDDLDLASVMFQLPSDYVMFYKMHPLLADASLKEGERIVNVSHEDLYMLLCACDCLITDYSSILFDYSLLGKKAICYASDYEDYQQTIGFNVQYQKEMPSKICTNEQELIEQLSECSFDEGKMKKFQEMFMPFDDGGNAKRVYAHIQKVMNS